MTDERDEVSAMEQGRIEHAAFQAQVLDAADRSGADVVAEHVIGEGSRVDLDNRDAHLLIEIKPEHEDVPPEAVALQYADQLERYADEAPDEEVMLVTYHADDSTDDVSFYATEYASHVEVPAELAAEIIADAEDDVSVASDDDAEAGDDDESDEHDDGEDGYGEDEDTSEADVDDEATDDDD